MNPLTVILLGRSGAGKGTQAALLAEHLAKVDQGHPTMHLESGRRFRDFIAGQTYAASLSRGINETGGLQPEFLSVWAWTGEMIDHLGPEKHLVIDGSPRRVGEARMLQSALQFFRRAPVAVLHLRTSREWSSERLVGRGRADDTATSIAQRMDWFESDVAAVVEHFRADPGVTFLEVDGEQAIPEVHASVLAALGL